MYDLVHQDYIFLYNDLINLNEKEVLEHFSNFGIKEGRKHFLNNIEKKILSSSNWLLYKHKKFRKRKLLK